MDQFNIKDLEDDYAIQSVLDDMEGIFIRVTGLYLENILLTEAEESRINRFVGMPVKHKAVPKPKPKHKSMTTHKSENTHKDTGSEEEKPKTQPKTEEPEAPEHQVHPPGDPTGPAPQPIPNPNPGVMPPS